VDHNLFLGNTAESGSGGGLRIQMANGTTDEQPEPPGPVVLDPRRQQHLREQRGRLGGGGVSIQDSVRVRFVNNTVASNDSTATRRAVRHARRAQQHGAAAGVQPVPRTSRAARIR